MAAASHFQRARWGAAIVPAGGLGACLLALGLVWLPDLPNQAGRMGVDYAFWLPNLLAGYFWHVNSGWWPVAWFNPAQCGGAPLDADPQGAYLSPVQLLTFAVGPVRAVQANFLLFAAAGYCGAYHLTRTAFGASRPASLLAGALFALDGFYAVRMMVGHLSFAPFMLLPAMAGCLLAGAGASAPRVILFGLMLAIMLQGGMAVLVLPMVLSLLMVVALHAALTGLSPARPLQRLALGAAVGLAICAEKLAFVFALMGNLPRNAYPLPGFANILQATVVALRGLFFWPTPDMPGALLNAGLLLERHEFDYRVGPVPLVLMLAAGWITRRSPSASPHPTRLWWEVLALLLVIPLALNTHATLWTAFLKSLPVIGASSSLLRWYAAYMLPAILGGAIALDRLAAHTGGRAWALSGAGIAATVLALLASDRGLYAASGLGVYDPQPITRAWARVAAGGPVPPVSAIGVLKMPDGTTDMSLPRQNMIATGQSPLFCYDPLFGYRLEFFPHGQLHAGGVFDETGTPPHLNLIDPVCYVFPRTNACAPGDTFPAAARRDAADFAAYRPFAWREPWWAQAAGWASLVSLSAALLALAGFTAARVARR